MAIFNSYVELPEGTVFFFISVLVLLGFWMILMGYEWEMLGYEWEDRGFFFTQQAVFGFGTRYKTGDWIPKKMVNAMGNGPLGFFG